LRQQLEHVAGGGESLNAEEAELKRRVRRGDWFIVLVRMKKATTTKPRPASSIEAAEAYIASVPEPAQTTLRELREIIRDAVPPEASEVISYGFPAFSLPKPFFGYAAFKNHLSLLPFSGSFFDSFAKELQPYTRTKGSLHLPLDQPLPTTLIRKLVHARVAGLQSPASAADVQTKPE
jgi:uncharacterized protein YdhG (YjbR/CyaY superfamily)